ncbi:hypothetical protein HPB50_011790 [Hyalomma asiaticum]|uniref:Uncharacterized protein n=1 Tax=Hyalomma asiaticum TaxID=266040 RepID=A0ACB7S829_HYAAI|nr:hypothetical protein HPB50_011790 [Hyalomma asiaticum]
MQPVRFDTGKIVAQKTVTVPQGIHLEEYTRMMAEIGAKLTTLTTSWHGCKVRLFDMVPPEQLATAKLEQLVKTENVKPGHCYYHAKRKILCIKCKVTYKVFVYGTLKVGEEHNYILANPENGMANLLGNAETVDRWPLVVLPSTGVPYMVPLKGEGYRVAGEVYVVDDKMLEKLDELESVPDSYYRTELDVELLDQPGNSAVPFKAGNYFATHYDERMLRLPYISNFTTV